MFVVGATMVVLVAYDVVQTALRIGQRGGPLTLHLASWAWLVTLRFPRLDLEMLSTTSFRRQPPEEFARRVNESAKARRQVRWMAQDTGWSWSDATGERSA